MRNPFRREPAFPLPGLEPLSRQFGFERGKPVDRWYIERFLAEHSADVRGRVLELYEDTYTRWYGGDARDLQRGPAPRRRQPGRDDHRRPRDRRGAAGRRVRLLRDDADAAARSPTCAARSPRRGACWRDGGVCLATVPCISQGSLDDVERYGDWWRFTSRGTKLLFDEVYGAENVEVAAHGNVLSACAFLYGMAAEELTRRSSSPTTIRSTSC